jgi:hypothetical protein
MVGNTYVGISILSEEEKALILSYYDLAIHRK